MDIAPDRRPGNLPPDLPSLVGRAVDLAEIDRSLRLHRLVTVTGTAGVGKSHAALRAAADAADRFPDGVWVVPLAQVVDPAHVPRAVALALRGRDRTARDRTARDRSARPETRLISEHLAGRRCLVVLDTCEHLVEGCAALAAVIIAASPGTRVLATSRRRLHLPGEEVVDLAALPVPPDGADAADVARCPSAALLAERAREHDPGFAVTPGNAAAVTALCRRLGGLPLALERAAAQLARRSAADLAADPGLPPDDAAPGRSPVLAPHGGLWTAIGWSHELCTPAERLLWARAAVFAGAFTPEAAEDVCAGGPLTDVADALDGLVEKSVMIRRADGRHRLPAALREYGASWLGALGEERDTQRRHRDRYLAMAREAYPEWTRAGQVDWHRRLSGEFAEVRKALETCLADPGPLALEFAGALWFVWVSCAFEHAGRDILARALAHADTAPGPLRVRAAWALGSVMNFQGDTAGVDRCVAECRAAAPDPTAVRAADCIEAADRAMSGRPAEGVERLRRLAAEPWDDPLQEATWMTARAALAFAHVLLDDYPSASAVAEDLRRDGERRGEHRFRGYGHYIDALVALFSGDHGTAATRAGHAFESFKLLHDASNMALNLEVIAIADQLDGAHERAAVLLGVSTRLWAPDGGRARCTAPRLAQARRDCEKSIAAALGEEPMATLFRTGLHSAWP
ncbi:ATP-binding protein [Actinomadura rifamycini]|uniref:ATP-binding protein n=1 Tax=Actinomadura rifamycini TaxID=31962 RepID=UPI000685A18F|nr:hypothetical protein [Actinomadura rifamycini]